MYHKKWDKTPPKYNIIGSNKPLHITDAHRISLTHNAISKVFWIQLRSDTYLTKSCQFTPTTDSLYTLSY